MEGFWDAVAYCGFTDLGYSGLPYTWHNRREGRRNVKVRLDRELMNEGMMDLYGDSGVTHVQSSESDHCGILIKLQRSGMLKGLRHE
jgi:exonuclease III